MGGRIGSGFGLALATVLLGGALAWAYWPTCVWLVSMWNREPDYSHGYLVIPLALGFLWARRNSFPGLASGVGWAGLVLIGASVGVRWVGARYYVSAIDGWSIMFWVAGVVWLFGGSRLLWWSLPSIAFLWFLTPLPFRVERWLSVPLQRVAVNLSCFVLRCFGQPAIAEGNTIVLGSQQLEVAQACSGLRIFVGIVALAFAYVIVVRRSWWERAILLAATVPVALIANSTRIVTTGLLYQVSSGETVRAFAHDASGWVMIVFAAGLLGLVLWYLGRLVPEVQVVDVRAAMRRAHDEL